VLQNRVSFAAIVVGAWMIVVLAWTPATYLVETGSGWSPSIGKVFLLVLLNFLPWMIVTPIVFWLAARFPITQHRLWRHLLVQAGAGVLLVPLLTIGGTVLGALVLTPRQLSFRNPAATAITAFYAVPTYIAVAGIGQAVAYFERYRTRERLLARAELRALEAQLNPHFLFNALNAISTIGYRDPALADRALSHLSELLRLTLAPRPQEIPLRDEIGFIQGYLDLYSMIMPGQVSLDLSVEQSTWHAAVPTMLLQPLVENAIVHGIAKVTGGGELSLAATRIGERLRVVVGNDVPLNDHSSPGTGIGLGNLRERLRVLYGERANLNLTRLGQQANVVVELPYRESFR
jgi:two-component system, LytTR family, sensor histidine kinase AlgZ